MMDHSGALHVSEAMKTRYYQAAEKKPKLPGQAVHSEFLRTGRIVRGKENWLEEERRYLTYEEVAERTGKILTAAGERTHERLNRFHKSIQFPKIIFHRTFEQSPHLGYCHITAARTNYPRFNDVIWAFYIANFFSEIGGSDAFFGRLNLKYPRMYFAVAVNQNQPVPAEKPAQAKPQRSIAELPPPPRLQIDRSVNNGGILFQTHEKKEAVKNVLLLGARDEALRRIIQAL
jgi:hypothetical protein